MTVSKHSWPHAGLFLGLALTGLIGVFAPRSLAILPAFWGLIGVGLLAFDRSLSVAHLLSKRPVRWMIALIVIIPSLAALSSLWSIAPEISLKRAQKIMLVLAPATLLIIYLCAAPLSTIKRYAWMLPVGLITGIAINTSELYTGGALYRYLRGMDGALTSYEMAAFNRGAVTQIFLLIPTIFMVRALRMRKILRRALTVILIALAIMMLSKTDSQSSQIAFVLAAIIAFMFPYKWRAGYAVTLMLLIVTMLLSPFFVQMLFHDFGDQLSNIAWLKNGYAMQRLEIWDMVARYALQNPLYGHGIEATKAVPAFDTQTLHFRYSRVLHPHNFALQTWIEFGAFGIAALSCGIVALIRHISFQTITVQRMALGSLFAVLAVASTGYGIWQSWWLGLLVLLSGFCIIAARLLSER